jgi:hypothetical protein
MEVVEMLEVISRARVFNAKYVTSAFQDEINADRLSLGWVLVDRSSRWGNPFRIGADGDRMAVINKYKQWLFENPLPQAEVQWLWGRHLVCHCAPEPCHADVLLRYVNFHYQPEA